MITALPRIAIAVNDFDAAITVFRDQMGMFVDDFTETVPSGRSRSDVSAPGGSNIELMAPRTPRSR